jgi:magnesium-transporting ATPase (P-type)
MNRVQSVAASTGESMASGAKSARESMASGARSARESMVSGASYTAKNNNITKGTLIFAVIMGIYFIIFFSLVIYEGVKDPGEDTESNQLLRIMSIVTVIVGIIIILLVPLVCVDRSQDKPASSMHVYGATYTALVVSLYATGLGGLSVLASNSKPNSKSMSTVLKWGGGVGCGAGMLVFIFSILALNGTD